RRGRRGTRSSAILTSLRINTKNSSSKRAASHTDSTTRPADGGTRDTEVTEKCSTGKGLYRGRNSGDSVPTTHRRSAWCCEYLVSRRDASDRIWPSPHI